MARRDRPPAQAMVIPGIGTGGGGGSSSNFAAASMQQFATEYMTKLSDLSKEAMRSGEGGAAFAAPLSKAMSDLQQVFLKQMEREQNKKGQIEGEEREEARAGRARKADAAQRTADRQAMVQEGMEALKPGTAPQAPPAGEAGPTSAGTPPGLDYARGERETEVAGNIAQEASDINAAAAYKMSNVQAIHRAFTQGIERRAAVGKEDTEKTATMLENVDRQLENATTYSTRKKLLEVRGSLVDAMKVNADWSVPGGIAERAMTGYEEALRLTEEGDPTASGKFMADENIRLQQTIRDRMEMTPEEYEAVGIEKEKYFDTQLNNGYPEEGAINTDPDSEEEIPHVTTGLLVATANSEIAYEMAVSREAKRLIVVGAVKAVRTKKKEMRTWRDSIQAQRRHYEDNGRELVLGGLAKVNNGLAGDPLDPKSMADTIMGQFGPTMVDSMHRFLKQGTGRGATDPNNEPLTTSISVYEASNFYLATSSILADLSEDLEVFTTFQGALAEGQDPKLLSGGNIVARAEHMLRNNKEMARALVADVYQVDLAPDEITVPRVADAMQVRYREMITLFDRSNMAAWQSLPFVRLREENQTIAAQVDSLVLALRNQDEQDKWLSDKINVEALVASGIEEINGMSIDKDTDLELVMEDLIGRPQPNDLSPMTAYFQWMNDRGTDAHESYVNVQLFGKEAELLGSSPKEAKSFAMELYDKYSKGTLGVEETGLYLRMNAGYQQELEKKEMMAKDALQENKMKASERSLQEAGGFGLMPPGQYRKE